jgi:hypothetical protein
VANAYTPEQVWRISDATSSGFVASRFAIDHWELFCQWATAHQPDETWDADDKQHMEADAKILHAMSEL